MGIFFEGGGGDDLVDMGNKMPGHLLKCGKFILGCLKPAVKDIQKVRADMAMKRAVNEMQDKIQSSDSAQGSAIAQSNSVATADLSPPPKRKR